jgi:hypothetical protein
VVVAISLLAIIGVGFLAALGTSARALLIADERETAKNISEMQMEYVKASSWTWGTYPQHPDIADAYPGYVAEAIPAPIESRDANIQKITVTVRRNGREIFSITGYKEKPEG